MEVLNFTQEMNERLYSRLRKWNHGLKARYFYVTLNFFLPRRFLGYNKASHTIKEAYFEKCCVIYQRKTLIKIQTHGL